MTVHRPMRGDDVEAWLKRQRDSYPVAEFGWSVIDRLLDEYRCCADYGHTLEEGCGDP
jgi:hypothetical protein